MELWSINQVYMAGLLTAPMVLIELAIMKGLYFNRAVNIAIAAIGVSGLGLYWFGIRQQ